MYKGIKVKLRSLFKFEKPSNFKEIKIINNKKQIPIKFRIILLKRLPNLMIDEFSFSKLSIIFLTNKNVFNAKRKDIIVIIP